VLNMASLGALLERVDIYTLVISKFKLWNGKKIAHN